MLSKSLFPVVRFLRQMAKYFHLSSFQDDNKVLMICSTRRISWGDQREKTNISLVQVSKSKFSPLAQVGPLPPGQVLLEVRADQEGPRKHRTLRYDCTLRGMKGLETFRKWSGSGCAHHGARVAVSLRPERTKRTRFSAVTLQPANTYKSIIPPEDTV